MWRIQLLGGLKAQSGDRVINRFRTRKSALLLAYLACDVERAHPREELIERLWPERDPIAGRNNLSRELSWLRDQMEPPGVPSGAVLVADRVNVRLNPAAVTTDLAMFVRALGVAEHAPDSAARAQILVHAVEQYCGELLLGFYDDWILARRQWLAEQYTQALGQLMTSAEQAGDVCRAIHYARQAVNSDPLREEMHYGLIRLLAAHGETGAALRQYHELERILRQELGAAPDEAARRLARELERRSFSSSPSPAAHRRHNDGQPAEVGPRELEPVGGAVPLDSTFYVVRPTDAQFAAAITRRDSIVLVKGTRQVGKTSLLARGLQQARRAGAIVVRTDLQMLNAAHLASPDALLRALAESIADQLHPEVSPRDVWKARRGPNPNFQQFMEREVLGPLAAPVVWGLDQVDRLFSCDFGPDLFGMFRSWHNDRALNPAGPWSRLTLAIAYATEAHLFIRDGDQSPFNVGTQLTLEDFTLAQIAELNRRYGSPLKDEADVERFFLLVGGHTYLVRRGLHELATHDLDLAAFEACAGDDNGIFGNHLRGIRALLTRDRELSEIVREVLQGRGCPTPESFYRLRSAGVIIGDSEKDARPRCPIYASYLERHLPR